MGSSLFPVRRQESRRHKMPLKTSKIGRRGGKVKCWALNPLGNPPSCALRPLPPRERSPRLTSPPRPRPPRRARAPVSAPAAQLPVFMATRRTPSAPGVLRPHAPLALFLCVPSLLGPTGSAGFIAHSPSTSRSPAPPSRAPAPPPSSFCVGPLRPGHSCSDVTVSWFLFLAPS